METKEILKNLKDISENKNSRKELAFTFKNLLSRNSFDDRFQYSDKYLDYSSIGFYYGGKDYTKLSEEEKKSISIKFINKAQATSNFEELNLKTKEEIKEFFVIYYKLLKNSNLPYANNSEKTFLLNFILRFGLKIYDDLFTDIFNYSKAFSKNFWIDLFLRMKIDSKANNKKDTAEELTFVFKKIFKRTKPLNKLICDNSFSKELFNIEKENELPCYQLFLYYIKYDIGIHIKVDKEYLDEVTKSICNGEIKNKKDFSTLSYYLINDRVNLNPEYKKLIKNSDSYKQFLNDSCYEKIVSLKTKYRDFGCLCSLIKEKDLLEGNSIESLKIRFSMFRSVTMDSIAINYLEFLSLFKKGSFSYKNIVRLLLVSNDLFTVLKRYNFLNEKEKEYFNKYAFEIINETENFKKQFFLRLLKTNKHHYYYENHYNDSCVHDLRDYLIKNLDNLNDSKRSIAKKIIVQEKL